MIDLSFERIHVNANVPSRRRIANEYRYDFTACADRRAPTFPFEQALLEKFCAYAENYRAAIDGQGAYRASAYGKTYESGNSRIEKETSNGVLWKFVLHCATYSDHWCSSSALNLPHMEIMAQHMKDMAPRLVTCGDLPLADIAAKGEIPARPAAAVFLFAPLA